MKTIELTSDEIHALNMAIYARLEGIKGYGLSEENKLRDLLSKLNGN